MTSNPVTGVYALRYAYRTESVRGEHFYGHDHDCHGNFPIDYYVWAICREKDVVLVDAGFSRETARRRGARVYLDTPAALLASLGRTPDEVSQVVLSHLHYDHTGTLPDFPNAAVLLQRAELDFWTGPYARRGAYPHVIEETDLTHLTDCQARGALRLLDGDTELEDGIQLHRVGGHTPGLQIVSIDTGAGAVVLAADASHFYENYESDTPYAIVHELPAMYDAFDTIRRLAGSDGIFVPGHDPLVRSRHTPHPANANVTILHKS
jgi:glyoxylase-like metal-dependent hydrolase (beta-lactamase superfamily II)